MAESMERTLDKIRGAWREAYEMPAMEDAGTYVVETFPDHVIVCVWGDGKEACYQVGYEMSEAGEILFDDRIDWTPVERKTEWVEAAMKFRKSLGENLIAFGAAMKTWKSEDGQLGYVEALGARFFDGEKLDTDLQYFDDGTDFGQRAGDGVDATLNHRLPIRTKNAKANEILKNLVKMKFKHPVKAEKTDLGLVAKHVLDLANDYEKLVFELAQKGAFRWSPGSAPHMVNFQKSGNGQRIAAWPIIEWAYTPTPADPNLPAIMPVKNYKPLEVASLLDLPESEGAGDALTASAQGFTIHAQTVHINQATESRETVKAAAPFEEKPPMSDKLTPEMEAALDAVATRAATKAAELAAEKAVKNFEDRQANKTIVNDPGYAVPKSVKTGQKSKLGDNEVTAMAAFFKYGDIGGVRHMLKGRLGDLEEEGEYDKRLAHEPVLSIKASNNTIGNVATAADGGDAVPTGHVPRIMARRDEAMLRAALGLTRVPGKGTTVNHPIDNEADGEFVLTSEQVDAYTNTFDRDFPAISKKAFTLLKYSKSIELTDELLEDEDSNMLAFVEDFVGRGMAKKHNSLLLTEVAANGTNLVTFATASSIGIGKLETMEGNDDLGAYLDDSGSVGFVMRNSTLAHIRSLGSTSNYPYSVTEIGGPGVRGSRELLQYPVQRSNQAAAIAASAKSVYFGNWAYVGFRDGPDIQILRNPYKYQGLVLLEYYFRTVYGVLIAEAIGYGVHGTNTA